MPNTRSDGARSTGAAIATVTIRASAETAATSAALPRIGDYRGKDQRWSRNRPAPHVTHVNRQARVAGEGVQRHEARCLRQPEHCEPDEETPPANCDKGRDPQGEIEADLERRQERDRSLRIV